MQLVEESVGVIYGTRDSAGMKGQASHDVRVRERDTEETTGSRVNC